MSPSPARLAPPAAVTWLRDEAELRPPAIARLIGLAPEPYARWCAGAWDPQPGDVPLLAALAAVHARARAAEPDPAARRRWWTGGRRELGWLSPAELLRRGKVGEVLILLAARATPDADAAW